MRYLYSSVLILLTSSLYGQKPFGEGTYSIRLEHPNGCWTEIQTENPNFNEAVLDKIVPILMNVASETRGYKNEFSSLYLFPYNYPRQKKNITDYKNYVNEKFIQIKLDNEKLRKLEIPQQFDTLKSVHDNNRSIGMEFVKIIVEWVNTEDDLRLQNHLITDNHEFNNLVKEILEERDWVTKFKRITSEIKYDEFVKPEYYDEYINPRTVMYELYRKYKIYEVSDECSG